MKKAFSLFEVSIAIIIIAIIISSILGVRHVKQRNEIKEVMSEFYDYGNIFKAFYQVYKEIPGDTIRGYELFNDDKCVEGRNSFTNEWGCNGNGNNIMDFNGPNADHREIILSWYHLYKAGFIIFDNHNNMNWLNEHGPGRKIFGCHNTIQNIGYNVPDLKLRDVGIIVLKYDGVGDTHIIDLSLKKELACKFDEYIGAFTPRELAYIDKKYDNGNITSGTLKTLTEDCITKPKKRKKDQSCDLIYRTSFTPN